MNKIFLTGYLCSDPRVKEGVSGRSCSFSVGCRKNRSKSSGDDSDFFFVYATGSTAEFVNSYLKKGDRVAIVGSMSSYKKDLNGTQVEHWLLYCDTIEIISSRRPDVHSADTKPVDTDKPAKKSDTKENKTSNVSADYEDLPF